MLLISEYAGMIVRNSPVDRVQTAIMRKGKLSIGCTYADSMTRRVSKVNNGSEYSATE